MAYTGDREGEPAATQYNTRQPRRQISLASAVDRYQQIYHGHNPYLGFDAQTGLPCAITAQERCAYSPANRLEQAGLDQKLAAELNDMVLDDASCSSHDSSPSDSCSDSEMSSMGPGSVGSGASQEGVQERQRAFPLLRLPLEIRLQIYRWVHLQHPIHQEQLAPWYPTPTYGSYFVRRVRVNDQVYPEIADGRSNGSTWKPPNHSTGAAHRDANSTPGAEGAHDEGTGLLRADRPLCGLPTALLLASRQVYQEARALPLRASEFVFANWFASGLWAARALLRELAPWQRAELRWARLELLATDLAAPAPAREWAELCGARGGPLHARGLRGLRLRILCGGGEPATGLLMAGLGRGGSGSGSWQPLQQQQQPQPQYSDDGHRRLVENLTQTMTVPGTVESGVPGHGVPAPAVRGADGAPAVWVSARAGLAGLPDLCDLEVELIVASWGDARKVAWCAELEDALSEARGPGRPLLRVVCVERDPQRRAALL